eukprot:16446217-Heterocapsa_arctica.AAC.1
MPRGPPNNPSDGSTGGTQPLTPKAQPIVKAPLPVKAPPPGTVSPTPLEGWAAAVSTECGVFIPHTMAGAITIANLVASGSLVPTIAGPPIAKAKAKAKA